MKDAVMVILLISGSSGYLGLVVQLYVRVIWALTVSWFRSNTAKSDGTAEFYCIDNLSVCNLKL